MNDSQVVALVALTPAARGALGARSEARITIFPFRLGRESRISEPPKTSFVELRLGVAPQLNDIYLLEPPSTAELQISREHFAIERDGDQCFVVDRGSARGTIVAGTPVGGNRAGGRTELRHGDVITVGGSNSPYLFRFEVRSNPRA